MNPTKKEPNLTVSVIIPTHPGQKWLNRCLNAIINTYPVADEVWLIMDGQQLLFEIIPPHEKINHLTTGTPSGPAAARNLGASQASGDILFFVDSDVVVPSDIIAQIKEEFQTDPKLDALIGSYDSTPGRTDFLSQYRNLLHHYVHQTGREEASTFWGACGAIRRSVFEIAGGFDEEQFSNPSIEDIELGYRLRAAGFRIKLCKDIQVKHLKKWEPRNMLQVDFFQRALPWTKLILQQGSLLNDLNLKVSNRWSIVLVFLLVINGLLIFWKPALGWTLILVLSVFLCLNYRLYKFYYQLKGAWFTLRVIPWQVVFYLISGIAFINGLITFYWSSKSL